MIPQYDSSQSIQLRYGFSRLDRAGDYKTRGPKSTAVSFQSARAVLKASEHRCLYLAWRQGRTKTWRVGELRKDRLGRIRFYDGWPHMNGLTQLTEKDPFARSING